MHEAKWGGAGECVSRVEWAIPGWPAGAGVLGWAVGEEGSYITQGGKDRPHPGSMVTPTPGSKVIRAEPSLSDILRDRVQQTK